MSKTKPLATAGDGKEAVSSARPTRRELKHARQLLSHGRRLLWIQGDLLAPSRIESCRIALEQLQDILKSEAWPKLVAAVAGVEQQCRSIKPARPFAAWRENIEAVVIAVVIAGAVRTYFVQPFKIPTGSMQPTLYGNHPEESVNYDAFKPAPSLPVRIWQFVLFGISDNRDQRMIAGDRIFVDRFTYNFSKPKRGDVIVFRTRNIHSVDSPPRGDFYIKRLVGLSGETIQIRKGELYINDSPVTTPAVFQKIYDSPKYSGYMTVEQVRSGHTRDQVKLFSSDDYYMIPPNSYFVFGDNTKNSTDSRYWGEFPQQDIVGRAFLVYWPLSDRFGTVD